MRYLPEYLQVSVFLLRNETKDRRDIRRPFLRLQQRSASADRHSLIFFHLPWLYRAMIMKLRQIWSAQTAIQAPVSPS